VYAPGEDVARLAFFGLFALQHRGQESAGIATSDGERIRLHTNMGLVNQAFREEDLERLTGHMAIGHTRYSTTGSNHPRNAQPFLVSGPYGQLALGHNGNLINALELRQELVEWDIPLQSATDSEVIAHLLAQTPGRDWGERVAATMRRLQGAYCLVVQTQDSILGIRDPLGVHPLCIGRLNSKGWVLASETCALDHLGAEFVREVAPGEAVQLGKDGLQTVHQSGGEGKRALCLFEYIYLARPDSSIANRLVYSVRHAMGQELAREHPADADVVIGVPDSAMAAAAGYAQASGIPYQDGLIKNRYAVRTFIEPDQRIRDLGVRLKFNPMREVLQGKRVVLVDDSIVRGTTTPHVVDLLRKAGAREVHVRVGSPPIRHPCFFGVDMGTRRELLASSRTIPEIQDTIAADSLGYLSVAGLMRALGAENTGFCGACFTGNYPIPVQLEMDKLALEELPDVPLPRKGS
jgi:amidophosphoribosyltransferase